MFPNIKHIKHDQYLWDLYHPPSPDGSWWISPCSSFQDGPLRPKGGFVKWDDLASAKRLHLDGTFFMVHDEADYCRGPVERWFCDFAIFCNVSPENDYHYHMVISHISNSSVWMMIVENHYFNPVNTAEMIRNGWNQARRFCWEIMGRNGPWDLAM